ncbi:LINE-1 retrotransposable element ORF2 protein [Bienertia sinuspersici]
MESCGMQDIPYSGHYYTWSNKQVASERVFTKLDRVMANDQWLEVYKSMNAVFLAEGCSDHCPALLRMNQGEGNGKKPFKYFRMWQQASDYKSRIKDAWEGNTQGTAMFNLVKKMKRVKETLKSLNKNGFCSVQAAERLAYQQLLEAQDAIQTDPHNAQLIEKEINADKEYREKHKNYMQFLRQKAKIEWVREGDENSALFHSSIRKRRIQNTVYTIKDKAGVFHDTPDGVQEAFLDYYQELLGSNIGDRRPVNREIVQTGPVVSEEHNITLTKPITPADVKKIVFSLNGDKAPGPDGFGAHFFKHNWEIIGEDTTKAVLSFFKTGRLLKEVNNTFISLVPKVSCPQDVTEFRPIACCNTIYKIITKLLCLRLKEVLPDLISENQGAFVHGRYIVHNIMVCQDLVRKYGRKNVSPSCMIKLDLRKAYDTVEWSFIQEMLEALNFPQKFIGWIMTCMTTPKFSLVLNGSPCGYFKTTRGLRQGDPLSPLLFVIGMEYLSRIMRKLHENPSFKMHPRCKGLNLTHMCFADDLILCCKGEKNSIEMILDCFTQFSSSSGLQANRSKTEFYTCGMSDEEQNQIFAESGFRKGSLPFKYLGVPICSKRINAGQCEALVDKMTARIRMWSSRNISFAGRSQLINSVLISIHQYWAQVFVLPKSVLKEIDQICRAYLWTGQWYSSRPGYIAWNDVCREKKEGGLGFRNIKIWNIACMERYVWAISTKQDSLWLKWINSVYLKGKEWWTYQPPPDSSWYWRKICEVKDILKQHCTQHDIMKLKKYSVAFIYKKLMEHKQKVKWARNIWTGKESADHLFFECNFSREILQNIKQWLRTTNQVSTLEGLFKWINKRGNKHKVYKATWNAAATAIVYSIWKERNDIIHGSPVSDMQQIIQKIKFWVKERIRMIDKSRLGAEQIDWLDNL